MSRRRKRVDSYRRDAFDITRFPVDSDPVYTYREINPPRDRRFFQPEIARPRPEQFSVFHPLRSIRKRINPTLSGMYLAGESATLRQLRESVVCFKRKLRREILFAKGRGGGHHKKPKYNQDSAIKCRR